MVTVSSPTFSHNPGPQSTGSSSNSSLIQTLRCSVRDNPLVAVGAALAAGLLAARLSR